jgi:preprotein translocase subunit SecA
MNDLIYRTKRAKYNAVLQEVEQMRKLGRPVLVGTTSVEVSETISRMFQRAKLPHSVLNARQHGQEAEVVAKAGQKGSVTIATNMAGRGTDIKLGPGVRELGGLHILGTERHESRRIDRQLRGRAGRQGDPGSSQFYISLEDDLMRLFGGDKMTKWMDKLGAGDQVLESSMLNKSVTNAQKKVEENNFETRKRLLDYDDVMNSQRTVIYDLRSHALHGERLKGEVFEYLHELIEGLVDTYFPDDLDLIRNECRTRLLVDPKFEDDPDRASREDIRQSILDAANEFYDRKEESLGAEFMGNLERWAVLTTIDTKWRDHLREMDDLKNGIYLRSYGQKDPLVEYKRESYEMFQLFIADLHNDILSTTFRTFPQAQPTGAARNRAERREMATRSQPTRGLQYSHAAAAGIAAGAEQAAGAQQGGSGSPDQKPQPMVRDRPKIGRNDPCYCGSGKKFKHCHGR